MGRVVRELGLLLPVPADVSADHHIDESRGSSGQAAGHDGGLQAIL